MNKVWEILPYKKLLTRVIKIIVGCIGWNVLGKIGVFGGLASNCTRCKHDVSSSLPIYHYSRLWRIVFLELPKKFSLPSSIKLNSELQT